MPIYALGDIVPDIAAGAYVHPDAVLIGAVTVGPRSSIWPGAILRADVGAIVVGAETSIQDGVVLHTGGPDYPTVIGDRCIVGHVAHIEGAVINDECLIGAHATVMRGAYVGAGATVAAGALVGHRAVVPARARAVGVPARIDPGRSDIDEIRAGARWYVQNANRYSAELRRVDLGSGAGR